MSGTFGRSAGPVESRPHSLLAVNNTKYEKACAELYLANQGIEKISNFEGFANLYFLYLNNNKVRGRCICFPELGKLHLSDLQPHLLTVCSNIDGHADHKARGPRA
jgi:hypothetical protein